MVRDGVARFIQWEPGEPFTECRIHFGRSNGYGWVTNVGSGALVQRPGTAAWSRSSWVYPVQLCLQDWIELQNYRKYLETTPGSSKAIFFPPGKWKE